MSSCASDKLSMLVSSWPCKHKQRQGREAEVEEAWQKKNVKNEAKGRIHFRTTRRSTSPKFGHWLERSTSS